jgi:peroxiredoxin Q/BCP
MRRRFQSEPAAPCKLADTLGVLAWSDDNLAVTCPLPLRADGTGGLTNGDRVAVEEGKAAPEFSLTSDAGETVTLASFKGKPVVLYFYPKDDTPGCTKQACGIRDAWGEFERSGAVVLGVSPDDEASHVKFKEKYDLPFTLLADPDHATADAYGVWGEKSMYGKKYMGVERSTFVIGADGTLLKEMRKVKPDTHADDVLAALSAADA